MNAATANDSARSSQIDVVSITNAPFGKLPDGSAVDLFTLKNADIEMSVATYGARVVALKTRDREGSPGDVVLGCSSLEEYIKDKSYMGVIAGRFANRIAGGRFTLEGETYNIPKNNGENSLHGGPHGFDRYVWGADEIPGGVEFTLVSPDGDNGFPGTLHVSVRYRLHGNTVRIEYNATTDKPTVVNLTNHAYFNLAGEGNGDVLGEVVTLEADHFTPVDKHLIPTGELAPVAGTPFDFTNPQTIASRIHEDHPQLKLGWGYDHNFVVRGTPGELRPAARVYNPLSGRVLTVQTTEPGMQFYSGNHLDGTTTGKSGAKYDQRTGFCLETQHYPDSPNHPSFPSTELKPEETFHSVTTWMFTVEK